MPTTYVLRINEIPNPEVKLLLQERRRAAPCARGPSDTKWRLTGPERRKSVAKYNRYKQEDARRGEEKICERNDRCRAPDDSALGALIGIEAIAFQQYPVSDRVSQKNLVWTRPYIGLEI
jgi:hypothetical protein